MSKYKVEARSLLVHRPTLHWWTGHDRADGDESADLATPHGLAMVCRYPNSRRPNGGMRFIFEGREYYRWYTPCPTRAGLVWMACREIRAIVGAET